MAVGYDVCMIHDFEGELYEYDFEGETAADDDCCKLLEADRRCCSKGVQNADVT